MADIERRRQAFWDAQDKKVTFRLEIETDELFVEPPRDLPGVPAMLGVLVGETVYNLRSALDYLVFDLALFNSKIEQRGTQFPIEDCEDLWPQNVSRFLKGIRVEHVAAIERCQPYKGSEFGWLARLRDISNSDKHRQWTVVVTSIVGNVQWKRGPVGSFGEVSRGDVYRTRLSDGSEVDVHVYGKLAAAITLDDRTSIVLTLQEFISGTTQILDAFKPEFE